MDRNVSLAALEADIAHELDCIAWPGRWWVKPRIGPDGDPMVNALVIGAGQGGLTIAHQLRREYVDRVLVIDQAPANRRGPWLTYGRMPTLRSPKQANGPDLDIPRLSFQAWFEAQHGRAAWTRLERIDRTAWAAYLNWFAAVVGIEVEEGAKAIAIRPAATHVAVDIASGPAAARRVKTVFARHVVLATGMESAGRWWMPPFLEALPPEVRNHTADAIDFSRLRGKVVAVLGAGASAFDNAATALESGAGEVHIFWRRPEMQRVSAYRELSYTGFFRHFGDLEDAQRWRMMRHVLGLRDSFPAVTWERVMRHGNVVLHPGAGWHGASLTADERLQIETAKGPFACDHAIAATGFSIDLAAREELAPFVDRVALWGDRYLPPAGDEDPRLAAFPYLGSTFEFTGRHAADNSALCRVRLFNFGATLSFGPSGSSINALKFSAPRLVSGITRHLFVEDSIAHETDLRNYAAPEF